MQFSGLVCCWGPWGGSRGVRSTWVAVCGGEINGRAAGGGGCVGDRCVDAVGGCAWAVLRVGRCGGQCGDIRVQFLVMGGQWAALCFEVAGWDCVGCAVWWYVLGCPEAGTVFPDGEALEGRWCWEVDRAVLVKGLP